MRVGRLRGRVEKKCGRGAAEANLRFASARSQDFSHSQERERENN